MIIKGANLGEQEVKFGNLTSFPWSENESIQGKIQYIETMYYSLFKKKMIFRFKYFLLIKMEK